MSFSKSRFLVFLQCAVLALFMWRGSIFRLTPLFLAVNAVSMFFGIWALWAMRKHLSAFPEPREDAKLLTKGPYALTRNPMYLALLLCLLPAALFPVDYMLLGAYLILILILQEKIKIEEKELEIRFSEFKKYKKTVKRILPWVL